MLTQANLALLNLLALQPACEVAHVLRKVFRLTDDYAPLTRAHFLAEQCRFRLEIREEPGRAPRRWTVIPGEEARAERFILHLGADDGEADRAQLVTQACALAARTWLVPAPEALAACETLTEWEREFTAAWLGSGQFPSDGHPASFTYARALRYELGLMGKHPPLGLAYALVNHCEGKMRLVFDKEPGRLRTAMHADNVPTLHLPPGTVESDAALPSLLARCAGRVLYRDHLPPRGKLPTNGEWERWADRFAAAFLREKIADEKEAR